MGTYTSYTGSIDFTPLKWGQFKDHPAANPQDVTLDCDVRLIIETETVDTEDGTLTVRTATGVKPITDDRFKGYDMQDHLQSVVDLVLAANHRAVFTGWIDAVSETAERWRFKVRHGRVERFEPFMSWPEGAED